MAPTAWETDEALGEAEATVVIAEAALTHFHQSLSSLKTSEHIVNEGEEWEWATSASAVAERIKQLKALRDEALAKLDAANFPDEAWINTIASRDAATDLLIEPWVTMGPWGTEQRRAGARRRLRLRVLRWIGRSRTWPGSARPS
jgi:hypothetical protein